MFYYLSFLRPPPTQVPLGLGFSITPQIANDLRTELFPEVQDIYYAWSPTQSHASTSTIPTIITKPTKLTTWRIGNAYREVRIPPPQGVKDGQAYRLVLTSQAQGFPHIVNLGGPSIGSRPFPVISMPIVFSSPNKLQATGKQEQVERIYRISPGSEQQAFLAIMEKTSFDLDKKIWDSGIGLSAWLVELASLNDHAISSQWVRDLRSLLFSCKHCAIVELGAGTGVASLTLGALRSFTQGSEAEGQIITTDLDSAMPLLEQNIAANESLFRSSSARPQPVVLDWDQSSLPPEVSGVLRGFDLIVMADVTYNTSSFPSLIRTLDKLLHLGVGDDRQSPIVLLGYKERHAEERTLWDMTGDIGIDLQKLDERVGAGEPPVEIWAARLSSGL